uniref:transposase n=1 Tax=Rhizomonospora bruguierae TaxID=1581705 RepID=UPI0020BE4952|nr:transposase [Micromonospora sp. NBRC 107566]
MGQLRLLRLALAPLLGTTPAPDHHHPGLPVAFALATAKTDERNVLTDLFNLDTGLLNHPDGLILMVDKGYRDAPTERQLTERNVTMIRPAYRTEAPRPGRTLLRALRQNIESVNQTFNGQLDLERHGGRTPAGVAVRVLQRILALTASIWHNRTTGQPVMRSLIAYDH